jgi:hypothetical protein
MKVSLERLSRQPKFRAVDPRKQFYGDSNPALMTFQISSFTLSAPHPLWKYLLPSSRCKTERLHIKQSWALFSFCLSQAVAFGPFETCQSGPSGPSRATGRSQVVADPEGPTCHTGHPELCTATSPQACRPWHLQHV